MFVLSGILGQGFEGVNCRELQQNAGTFMDVGPDNHADLHLKCRIAYIMKAGVAREQPRVSRSGKLGPYRDRRVEALATTSAAVASGTWQMGSA